MAKHPLLLEAIKNSKAAVMSTRGMYPYTIANNVFLSDGTTLAEITEEEEVVDSEEESVEG